MRIGDDSGRAALIVDGIVQSISPEDGLASGGYWAAMVPDDRPQRALILGLGGGTLARLLRARWGGDFEIVGVDDNAEVLDTASEVGWLPCNGLEIVVADAFEYVQTCPDRFDYIAVDLFRGEDIVARAFRKTFLKRLRVLLVPRGRLVVNMFSDIRMLLRLARIGTVFEIRDQIGVGGNVVVHARRRR